MTRKTPDVTCRAHCTGCDQHFSSVSAFDAHRVGPHDERSCELGENTKLGKHGKLVLTSPYGVCDLQPPHRRVGVEVWGTGYTGPAA